MNIFAITPILGDGGAERVLLGLAAEWSKENNIYIFATSICDIEEYPIPKNVNVIRAKDQGATTVRKKVKLIVESCERLKIDVVLAFAPSSSVLASMAKKRIKAKVICAERNSPKDYPENWLLRHAGWRAYRKADGMVFQTSGAASFFKGRIKNFIVIPNPVSIKIASPCEKAINKRILFAGRLCEQKNPIFAIKSFNVFWSRHKDYSFRIIGNDHLDGECQRFASTLECKSNISFGGFSNNILAEFERADFVIMTSRFEGIPNTLVESVACCTPFVSLNCRPGGCVDVCEESGGGILLKENCTVEEFASAMDEMSENLETYRRSIVDNLSSFLEKRKISKLAENWIDFFEKTIA